MIKEKRTLEKEKEEEEQKQIKKDVKEKIICNLFVILTFINHSGRWCYIEE